MTWVWYGSDYLFNLINSTSRPTYFLGQVTSVHFCKTTPNTFTGKTIQVISFLSAIMRKNGVETDRNRRRKHVSNLQDREAWKKRRELPPADATWQTCLIVAPSTVVHNWQREFETVGTPVFRVIVAKRKSPSGVTLKLVCTLETQRNVNQ